MKILPLLIFVTTFLKVPAGTGLALHVQNPVQDRRLVFTYELKKPAEIIIVLTDTAGAPLIQIRSGMWNSGRYREEYTVPDLPKGRYQLHLKTPDEELSQEVIM